MERPKGNVNQPYTSERTNEKKNLHHFMFFNALFIQIRLNDLYYVLLGKLNSQQETS